MEERVELTQRYLDLLKKTLMYALWDEVGIPIATYQYERRLFVRWILTVISQTLRFFGFDLVQTVSYSPEEKLEGRIWPIHAHTMIGLPRLNNIQYCVEDVIRNEVPGDFIETGVWKGGATIFMRAILAAHGVKDRKVFVADSFVGLPPPDIVRYPQDKGDIHHRYQVLAVSEAEVRNNFKKFGLLDDRVIFLKGWFKDTLPRAPFEKLAVIRLDGDMYEATMDALTHLYPRLSPGGYCIIDDYLLPKCKKAVEDYRAANNILAPLKKIDTLSVYWQK